jgi:hypothetical protein
MFDQAFRFFYLQVLRDRATFSTFSGARRNKAASIFNFRISGSWPQRKGNKGRGKVRSEGGVRGVADV